MTLHRHPARSFREEQGVVTEELPGLDGVFVADSVLISAGRNTYPKKSPTLKVHWREEAAKATRETNWGDRPARAKGLRAGSMGETE